MVCDKIVQDLANWILCVNHFSADLGRVVEGVDCYLHASCHQRIILADIGITRWQVGVSLLYRARTAVFGRLASAQLYCEQIVGIVWIGSNDVCSALFCSINPDKVRSGLSTCTDEV
jgi:hypothetical protein